MDTRYQNGQPLQVNLLVSREVLEGHIENLTGRMATIRVDRPLAFGAPLRMDFDDSIILGDVSACQAGPEGYRVGVDVRDAIPMMSDLGRLVAAVMAAGEGTARSEEAKPVRRSASA